MTDKALEAVTASLDEKASDAALAAWFANTAQGWHAAMEAAIRAYLAALKGDKP